MRACIFSQGAGASIRSGGHFGASMDLMSEVIPALQEDLARGMKHKTLFCFFPLTFGARVLVVPWRHVFLGCSVPAIVWRRRKENWGDALEWKVFHLILGPPKKGGKSQPRISRNLMTISRDALKGRHHGYALFPLIPVPSQNTRSSSG